MKESTISEIYGLERLTGLGFEADLIDEIADMTEDEIPTSDELTAMRMHADTLIRGLDSLHYTDRARFAEVMAEVESVVAAADRYSRLRRALIEIRAGKRVEAWAT
ncbi:hypothetical protein [Geopseudomonas guangdongensis]|uniref:Uncharacterized protein n=1 Tax=Geopseudomonas guangdongensis TaxID=1245526 RepID=A0A1H2ELX0_9GAMM|nr:hypothetical protein [Pseudomonas guangdongensis]SDT95999.1 hypothetical protein SAMN05216580_0693 [Pseudomonas guangdongensis]